MRAAKAGGLSMRREELEQMIRTYGRDLFSFCCSMTCSRQDAEDLYQDTFLKLYEIGEEISIEKNPKSFLMGIAFNLYRNHRRKHFIRDRIAAEPGRTEEIAALAAAKGPSTEEQAILRENCLALRRAVAKLPDKYKIPILLFYMEELPMKEIERILRLPGGTVKTRLRRAKMILKRELEGAQS